VPLHQALAADANVAAGRFHTRFLEHWLETKFAAPPSGTREVA
jgi:acetyl-CoA carboxylase biotin carboxylase subunit